MMMQVIHNCECYCSVETNNRDNHNPYTCLFPVAYFSLAKVRLLLCEPVGSDFCLPLVFSVTKKIKQKQLCSSRFCAKKYATQLTFCKNTELGMYASNCSILQS